MIPDIVFGKQNKVTALRIKLVNLIESRPCRNINFTADYRLYTVLFGTFVKIYYAVHISVVGYRHCRLSEFFRPLYQFRYRTFAIEQTVRRVRMKMYKAHSYHLCLSYYFQASLNLFAISSIFLSL